MEESLIAKREKWEGTLRWEKVERGRGEKALKESFRGFHLGQQVPGRKKVALQTLKPSPRMTLKTSF